MKKITFILLALIAGTGFAQETNTDNATANAGAEIIKPIIIDWDADLYFGRIIGNASGGTVNVDKDGVRTSAATPEILDPSTAGTANISAAQFTIKAAEDYSYGISIPATVTIAGGVSNMEVTLNPFYNGGALSTASPKGSSAGSETLIVGGDLLVGETQAQGSYTATFDVVVTYE